MSFSQIFRDEIIQTPVNRVWIGSIVPLIGHNAHAIVNIR